MGMLACSPTPHSTAGRPHRPARYCSLPQCDEILTCPSLDESSELLETACLFSFLFYFFFYLWQVCKGQWFILCSFLYQKIYCRCHQKHHPGTARCTQALKALQLSCQTHNGMLLERLTVPVLALRHQGHPPAAPTKQELAIKSLT